MDSEEDLKRQISYWQDWIKPTTSHINQLRKRLSDLRKSKKSNDKVSLVGSGKD